MPNGYPPSGGSHDQGKDRNYYQQQQQQQHHLHHQQQHQQQYYSHGQQSQGQRREQHQQHPQHQQQRYQEPTLDSSFATPFTMRRGMNALWTGGAQSSQKLVASTSFGSLSTVESSGDASSHAGRSLPARTGGSHFSSQQPTPQQEQIYSQQYHQQRLPQSSSSSQRRQPEALVLGAPESLSTLSVTSEDPSNSRLFISSAASVDETSSTGGGSSIGVGAVRKILQAGRDQMTARQGSSRSRRRGRSWQGQLGPAEDASATPQEIQRSQQTVQEEGTETAASFARSAPKAGFLHKLGQNIHQYKRRFFVLKPTTHLYYFVSPTDAEPRGCIDLDSLSSTTTLREVETLPDGRFRFEIIITSEEDGLYGGVEANGVGLNSFENPDNSHSQRILLEARNEDVGREWMSMIDKERLSRARSDVDTLEREKIDLQSLVDELERQVADFRLVEKDRDMAVQDAADWRKKFHRLDEAVRLLTHQIRRPPEIVSSKNAGKNSAEAVTEEEGNNVTATDDNDTKKNSNAKNDEAGGTNGAAKKPDESKKNTMENVAKEENKDNALKVAAESGNGYQLSELTKSSPDEDAAFNSSASVSSTPSHDRLLNISYEERLLDKMDLSGTHFSALSNACQRLRDNLIVTSTEANTVLSDLIAANLKVQAVQKRMTRAERHLCKLWEENCEMRSSIKRSNKERKVLVREVRSLQQQLQQCKQEKRTERQKNDSKQNPSGRPPTGRSGFATPHDQTQTSHDVPRQQKRPSIGPNEQKLILELEEHVMSSLRLHEQFIMVNGGERLEHEKGLSQSTLSHKQTDRENGQSLPNKVSVPKSAETIKTKNCERVQCNSPETEVAKIDMTDPALEEGSRKEWPVWNEDGEVDECQTLNMSLSPIAPTRLPLVQKRTDVSNNNGTTLPSSAYETPATGKERPQQIGRSNTRSSQATAGEEDDYRNEMDDSFLQSSLSSGIVHSKPGSVVGSDVSGQVRFLNTGDMLTPDCSFSQVSVDDYHKRKHPLVKLDEDSEDRIQPHMFSSFSQSESTKSMITDSGRATSRLTCPLADLHQIKSTQSMSSDSNDDVQVYHLTFYTKKIGLQFQKVPVTPAPSKGILTEAMTADIRGRASDGDCDSTKTAAELRRIASISQNAMTHHDFQENPGVFCPVSKPVDIVLVCGFHGFDDVNNKTRPKLGARLIAFDGVSVEVGEWTFESVRKAIHARGRPLTLSFRNDFLTTKQRSILNKAISDVTETAPPPKPTLQYRMRLLRNPYTPFAEQHQTDSAYHSHSRGHDSGTAMLAPSPARSINSVDIENHRQQDHYEDAESMRSFTSTSVSAMSSASLPLTSAGKYYQTPTSESGGSSIFSSTIGPLVSNIMSGISKQTDQSSEQFTPSYLQRDSESLNTSRQHHDFKAGLL